MSSELRILAVCTTGLQTVHVWGDLILCKFGGSALGPQWHPDDSTLMFWAQPQTGLTKAWLAMAPNGVIKGIVAPTAKNRLATATPR